MYKLQNARDLIPMEEVDRFIREGASRAKCENLHPSSCNRLFFEHFFNCWSAAYKTYLVVYLIQVLIQFKKVKNNPKHEIPKLILAYLKSTSLIPVHTAVTRRLVCLFTNNFSHRQSSLFWTNLIAGFYVLVESPSRQAEIALYQLNNSGNLIYNMLARRGWVKGLPYGQTLLLGGALMLLCHHYFNNQDAFRKNYILTLMKYLTGQKQ